MSINIRSLHIDTDKEVFQCELSVLVDDSGVVTDLCSRLNKIAGVQKASRVH